MDALQHVQKGLCGYCEIDIRDGDRQVEHFIPRSEPSVGSARSLDVTNMIACCQGGTSYNGSVRGDQERRRSPVGDNVSCGQSKDKTTGMVDPRCIPSVRSLMRVLPDGRVVSDKANCASANVSSQWVEQSIGVLGLNVERLRVARERRWNALQDVWGAYFTQEGRELLAAAARMELLPNTVGQLSKFFSTTRSYFGMAGEQVLRRKFDYLDIDRS